LRISRGGTTSAHCKGKRTFGTRRGMTPWDAVRHIYIGPARRQHRASQVGVDH
jgi:hypothetical protein